MNLAVLNLTYSVTGPGVLKATAGSPSDANIFVKDSVNLVFPVPGMPETIITLALSIGPYFNLSTISCV